MSHENIRDQIRLKISAEEHKLIRHEWMVHSIAEEKRDIPGLLSTLTEDCIYTVLLTGHTWEGHAGAERFYTEFLAAFPDVYFDLQNIVIGPQGVFEEAIATATHEDDWLDKYPATGKKIEMNIVIFFPWDPIKKKFAGERMYVDSEDQLLGR